MKRLSVYITLIAILVITLFFIITYLEREGLVSEKNSENRSFETCLAFPYSRLGFYDKDSGEKLSSEVKLEVACNNSEREQGLSYRNSLENNTGMFFVFEKSDNYGFWMKDMRFSIDIVWIDEDLNIVKVSENVSPDTYPKSLYPDSPVKYVLELNSGEASSIGLKKGIALVPKR
jgi:uncharacterized membrane protein (UPF0127 family)